jgi:hypothetical protein
VLEAPDSPWFLALDLRSDAIAFNVVAGRLGPRLGPTSCGGSDVAYPVCSLGKAHCVAAIRQALSALDLRIIQMTIDDDAMAVKKRLRAQKDEIERQVMQGLPEWTDYLARLSKEARMRVMKAMAPDRTTFERWWVLELATEDWATRPRSVW